MRRNALDRALMACWYSITFKAIECRIRIRLLVAPLSGSHSRTPPAHVYRAVIEGICFGTEAILRAFQTDEFRLTEVVIAGGAAKSAFWLQTHADVSGLPLIRTEIADAPALGSAILAAVGAKLFDSIGEAVQAMVRNKEIIEPNEDKHAVYAELFESYSRMYGAIKEIRENTPKKLSRRPQ